MGTHHEFCPFDKANQLNRDLEHLEILRLQHPDTTLPWVSLRSLGQPVTGAGAYSNFAQFLRDEFCDQDFESMSPYLWMMSTQSSANINALHRQRAKGRQIIVTERPHLHLVWVHDRIFLKPLPKYLLSYSFWEFFLLDASSPLGMARHEIRKAALGYLRTYKYLINHETDFRIAQEEDLQLVPADARWYEFCDFVSRFDQITDNDVSGRYCYGEVRLTRLNFYCKFILRKFHFEQIHLQYDAFYSRFYPAFLFVFGILSVVFSAMQVEMSIEQVITARWQMFIAVCRWFSVIVVIGMTALSLAFGSLLCWMILDEWVFALRARRHKRKEAKQCVV